MPILVTRHGMVNHTTLHLDTQGQRYANALPSLVTAMDANYASNGWGYYANNVAASDGYQRCKATIEPLADAAGYSIDTFPDNGVVDVFEGLLTQTALQGSKWAGISARLGELNSIRHSSGLRAWTSAAAYMYFMVFTYKNGKWVATNHLTGQTPPSALQNITEEE